MCRRCNGCAAFPTALRKFLVYDGIDVVVYCFISCFFIHPSMYADATRLRGIAILVACWHER